MKRVLRWLITDRFSWLEVVIIGSVVATVAHYSLPWLTGIAICTGAGLVVGIITLLLRRVARR